MEIVMLAMKKEMINYVIKKLKYHCRRTDMIIHLKFDRIIN